MAKIRYNEKRGWTGGNDRALYLTTDKRTGATQVVPGWMLNRVGPESRIRLATAKEAERAEWPKGWKVSSARDQPRRTYATPAARKLPHFA